MSNQQQGDDHSIVIGTSVTDSAVVSGDGNIVTVTNTKIIQIAVDEIKTRELNAASPYKGLKPFEPEDRNRFFGRDQFLRDLVKELEQTNFVLLLGASGSGKSSVVRAGLIPLLQKNRVDDFDSLIFTPDLDPFESLYRNLPGRYKQSETQIARISSADTLSQVVNQLKSPKSFWLIFIDQFEELFTLSEPEKRDHFIASLVKLSQERADDPSVKIVATMRADFLDQLDPFPANQLASLTQKHRPLITQMHPDELRLAIEQPAAQHGVVFETGLVEIIVKDVQGQAGYLPLLQYTLNLLWQQELRRNEFTQERTLRTETYLRLGGVRGALQEHVDQIYKSLSEPEQIAAQRIFLKLVEIGGDESAGTEWKPVRRRAARSEFSTKTEQTVLMRLINNNLLVSDAPVESEQQQSGSQSATVEIAHEVLLTSWETLNTWIKENRQAIALRNRLYDDVRLWIKHGKRDDELWNGAKLEQVNELRANTTFNQALGGFTSESVEFIEVSNKLGKRQMQERIAAGDARRTAMMNLLEACTVSLSIPGQEGESTGFFVAPGRILTCAPKILEAGTQSIKVTWLDQSGCNVNEATIDRILPSVNLALLKLTHDSSHPCVFLDKTFQIDDPLCTYGYSNQLAKDGYSVGKCHSDQLAKSGYSAGKCQKQKKQKRHMIEFKTHQNSLELQSSPLLNWRTLKVCGIVQSTHDHISSIPDQDDVTIGKATSAATILAAVGDLKKEQRAFHKKDDRWKNLIRPTRCKPRTAVLASLGVTALIILIRGFQVFQPFELSFYDFLMRSRAAAFKSDGSSPSDNRFLIVTVTKEDAKAQEDRGEVLDYSLSNQTLVRLLDKIKTLNPVAIGFDMYRDQSLTVPSATKSAPNVKSTPSSKLIPNPKQSQIAKSAPVSGSTVARQALALEPDQVAKQRLSNLFKTEENLFAVCKAGDGVGDTEGVSPPPGVPAERVGFSDFSIDKDRILRRQLLSFPPEKTSRCQSNRSFGLLLAEHYLQKTKKIETTVSNEDCQIKFSNGVVLPANIQPNTGGYQGYSRSAGSTLFDSCQILLSYQDPGKYKTIRLEEFLNADLAKDYSNRIVMIGIDRSDGISDNLRTPFDQGPDQITPGVIVQAQMIDQIIDVATNNDTLIWVLPRGVDKLLILVFALVGGGVGWCLISLRQLGIFIVISCGVVLVISFIAFRPFHGWVPLMPQFLALSAGSSYVAWSNFRLQLNPKSK